MSTATCPHCGHALAVAVTLAELDGPAPRPAPPVKSVGDGGLPIARPRPVYRGAGAGRERRWGAVVDTPAPAGARLQIVARSGNTWTGTVAESLGTAAGGVYLVTLVGDEWTPDPDVDEHGRHPSDPAWLHDDAADPPVPAKRAGE